MPNIIEIVTRLFDREKSWSKLTSSEWVGLLVECPELADRCDRVNGWKSFSGSDWVELLEHQPRFAEQCGQWNGEEKFNVWDTIRLLKSQPCLIELCPLLRSDDAWILVNILDELPQMVDCCDNVQGWKNFCKPFVKNSYLYNSTEYANIENCWVHILIKHPEWRARCEKFKGWDDFKGKDWSVLLRHRPEFADVCDSHNGWLTMANHHWVYLLRDQIGFESQADSANIWNGLSGFDWVALLTMQPRFAGKCDEFYGWQKIDFSVLKDDNGLIVHGSMVIATGQVIEVSQVIETGYDDDDGDFVVEEYIVYDKNGQEVMRSKQKPCFCGRWAELLSKQPIFAKKCDEYNGWEVMDGYDWWRLVWSQPGFVKKCNMFDGWRKMWKFKFSEEYFENEDPCHDYESTYVSSLFAFPEEYKSIFSRRQWATSKRFKRLNILGHRVENSIDDKGNVHKMMYKPNNVIFEECLRDADNILWIYALWQECPDYLVGGETKIPFFDECSSLGIFGKFKKNDWCILLGKDGYFLNKIARFADNKFWEALFRMWPDWIVEMKSYATQHEESHRFEAWPHLLAFRPDCALYCQDSKGWEKFFREDWAFLLHERFHFLEKVNASSLSEEFWYNLLETAPQFVECCDRYNGWCKLSRDKLCHLIEWNPNLIEHCHRYINWNDVDANSWISMFRKLAFKGEHEKGFESELIAFCDEHSGWRLFSAREHEWDNIGWAKLLACCPQFEKQCAAYNGWSIFNGLDWQVLLSKQPQFAAKCDACNGWDVMSEKNWMLLIGRQEQFAGKYKSRPAHKYSKWPESTIVDMAQRFVTRENSRNMDNYDDYVDDYVDWREESGWNDVYGSGVDASDIIEFRD